MTHVVKRRDGVEQEKGHELTDRLFFKSLPNDIFENTTDLRKMGVFLATYDSEARSGILKGKLISTANFGTHGRLYRR